MKYTYEMSDIDGRFDILEDGVIIAKYLRITDAIMITDLLNATQQNTTIK